jgi:hypothetical protein
MSIMLLRLVLFLAPFGIYALYLQYVRRQQIEHPGWREAPWTWLIAAGFGVVIASFLWTAMVVGEVPGGVYVPPRDVDGKIVPGHIRRN